ncbi:tannase/feruloyl esterase family alpha/beta hydrolase [Jiulongibacter sp. NS-SX5]|uniref:tannase/feruloyl esterase family alpha/beta hydrolase n=1 Tax=Jiulongibacter sp. NS-SX5 TaxID=3463854 RepID=UPI004058C405
MTKSLTTLFLSLSFSCLAQKQELQKPLIDLYPGIKPACDCGSLIKAELDNTKIVSAKENKGSCNILAIVNHPPAKDSVKVWISLPIENWNGRFEGIGGGGFLGGLPFFDELLSQGFAGGATNTGHDGGSGSFALNKEGDLNWQLIQDNAYLGIHDMTVVGKALVEKFYGKPSKYNYFVGGSTGGRQGLSEAQRYPNDYDGILSFYPATNWHKFLVTELWPQVVMYELDNYISAEKFEAINKAIISKVDKLDGYEDGVIENPLQLEFDLSNLIGQQMGQTEFTSKDAKVVQKIWEGARTESGEFMWYGLPPGTPFVPLAGSIDNHGDPFSISVEWVAYFLKSNPNWNGIPLTMDEFQLLYNQSVEQYGSVFGTDNPDLNNFKSNGGKLLLIHGLSDRLIVPQGSINYYERVTETMGGPEKTLDFARLFLIPGMDHSESNPALRTTNHFDLLIKWVEELKAPEKINVEHRDESGNLTRTAIYNHF